MAKSWQNGQLILDSASQGFGVDTTSGSTSYIRAQSITVDPSAGAWVVVLSNQDGSVAWSNRGADARGDTYPGPFIFKGVVASTLTNVTRVILNGTQSVRA